jgi:hypothetical protein
MSFRPVQPSSDKAYAVHQGLIGYRATSKKEEWDLAAMLYVLRRHELWRFAVGGFDSWEDYLKQPEVNISRHKADKLVRIYEYFIVQRKYTVAELWDVPWTALDYISKRREMLDHDRVTMDALLADAKVLTTKDFKDNFFDATHAEDRTYSYVLMKKCDQTGNLEKVHDLDSETIKTKLNLT